MIGRFLVVPALGVPCVTQSQPHGVESSTIVMYDLSFALSTTPRCVLMENTDLGGPSQYVPAAVCTACVLCTV